MHALFFQDIPYTLDTIDSVNQYFLYLKCTH